MAVGPLAPLEGTWLAVANPDLRCQFCETDASTPGRTVAQVLLCTKCPVLHRGCLSAIVR